MTAQEKIAQRLKALDEIKRDYDKHGDKLNRKLDEGLKQVNQALDKNPDRKTRAGLIAGKNMIMNAGNLIRLNREARDGE